MTPEQTTGHAQAVIELLKARGLSPAKALPVVAVILARIIETIGQGAKGEKLSGRAVGQLIVDLLEEREHGQTH